MYNTPGVFIEDLNTGSGTGVTDSNSIGAMIGVAPSGAVGVPILVKSFTEYVEKFANGLDSPFMANSYLSYAVHGFFANGGSQLYIVRALKEGVKASLKGAKGKLPFNVEALYEGTWGNDISISIKHSDRWASANGLCDVTVSLKDNKAVLTNVTLDNVVERINSSAVINKWLKVEDAKTGDTELLEVEEQKLTGGAGNDTIASGEYADLSKETSWIYKLDSVIDKVAMVAIPGITTDSDNVGLIKYCNDNFALPIIDMPIGSTVDNVVTYRTTTLPEAYKAKGYEEGNIKCGALVYPWGNVNDPLTDDLKSVPACGHTMGVYARIIDSRGIYKAPAGIEAYVNGFVSMEKTLTSKDTDLLNPVGVVSIMPKVNQGIVIWGARGLNDDKTMKYVSDILLNQYIKKTLYARTQYAVFEPNTETLWNKLEATCKDLLETLRLEGAFVGDKNNAYYVTVNSSNNTEATIEEGILNIEVGYAPTRPAEFIVIKLAHTIQN